VLRETTERPEAIESGAAELVGLNTGNIVNAAARILDDPERRAAMARASSVFGDGHASERIADAMLARLP
jgi:UDP-N-acetylglucosamine 2-epimerase (non-hydrolysing)